MRVCVCYNLWASAVSLANDSELARVFIFFSMSPPAARPTIGFLSTWSVYQGATIDNYMYTLLQGISTAAREHECNLLLGCGISLPTGARASHTAWSCTEANVDFVPVGAWNTDGLIIIPDDLSQTQFSDLEDLIQSDFPIVMTTAEVPALVTHNAHLVAVDNADGIRQAMQHLFQHGHRRIAFIAGKSGHGGDVAERLAAYRDMLRAGGIAHDPRLIAYGEHRLPDGRVAMQSILDTGADFTALLASNDLSCIGALQTLRAAGRRVPEDVAVIGFDDILQARSQLPPLTTVRHPTFALGYQSVVTLLKAIRTRHPQTVRRNAHGQSETRIPTQLVVRQSCGCRPENAAAQHSPQESCDEHGHAHAMAHSTVIEARRSSLEEIEPVCLALVRGFASALEKNDATDFDDALVQLTNWLDARNEDPFAWHAALSTLHASHSSPVSPLAHTLIDRARLEIAEYAQRQATDVLLQHMDISNRLGLMAAQLLAVLDAAASTPILTEHLPHLGFAHALVAAYVPHVDDEFACARVLLDAGATRDESIIGQEFLTREFPPRNFYDDAPFQVVLQPLVMDERVAGFVALTLDAHAPLTNLESCAAITHNLGSALRSSRLYREALQGQQLAEEANRLKSRFLSTVSHELRTPLSLIVGLSDMVLEQNEYALSRTTQRDLEQIHASAQHLGRLINDVLDLASSEAGQLRLHQEPLDLVQELNAVAQIGAEMARGKNLRWRAQFSFSNALVRVLGDRTRVRQIILNLISNAVKFTARGMIALDARVDDDTVTIAVSDTGIGILREEQTKLFREFQRAERTVNAGYGGMGLGLAISKHLVEQHGGAIGVRSPGDLGNGSTFYFTLPRVRITEITNAENDLLAFSLDDSLQPATDEFKPFTSALLDNFLPPLADVPPRLVLVVDDDPDILAFHSRLVTQQGHRAIHARNGREALDLLETTRPSLVLLDLMMPELDGFHVLDALRARETTRDIPVIVLTARSLDETEIEKLNRGVAAIMAKGLFRASETVKHIQAVLERQHALGNPTQRLVRRAMGFLHAHYAEPLTREQIAAHVNISPDYLTDCFRQEVGVTPMVYLNRYRLKQARDLLENSDTKITQIALAVGFSESAHFTRMFQREVGVSPKEWRKGKRG